MIENIIKLIIANPKEIIILFTFLSVMLAILLKILGVKKIYGIEFNTENKEKFYRMLELSNKRTEKITEIKLISILEEQMKVTENKINQIENEVVKKLSEKIEELFTKHYLNGVNKQALYSEYNLMFLVLKYEILEYIRHRIKENHILDMTEEEFEKYKEEHSNIIIGLIIKRLINHESLKNIKVLKDLKDSIIECTYKYKRHFIIIFNEIKIKAKQKKEAIEKIEEEYKNKLKEI